MKDLKTVAAALFLAGVLPLPEAYADTMSKGDYAAGKTRIGAAYKADVSACASRAGNAKDICLQEAKGKERVALAELEYGYTGKQADRDKVRVVKAESANAYEGRERSTNQVPRPPPGRLLVLR
ncbi:MAG: hypothetical protein RI988_3982 [Pseudomonadota bacterium]|jgi:hypothetical protein